MGEKESARELQTESAIRRSEAHFHHLLEKIPAGAYMCDPDGLITYYNRHAVGIWGREPKLNDPVDRFCGSFKLFSAEGSPIAHDRCWMALALKEGQEYNGHEIVTERPDGRHLTTLAHANPIRDEFGRLTGAVNILVDITERKRAEDALREADRSKNHFLATLAHELRNPLAPIRNAVQLLHLNGPANEDVQSTLGIIDRQMEQMTRLIDDLLDLARITGNKLELRKSRIELTEVLQAAVETSRPLIEAKGQELVADITPDSIFIDGDYTRLAQVVSNLLNNASKYTPHRGRICLKAERQDKDAIVTVADDGIGIPPDMLRRIFEMFTQVPPSTERPQDGLGIGLTLAKRLVEMHSGTIMARSDGSGQGSQFIVRLPLAKDQSVASSNRNGEGIRAQPRLALRILVVDDHDDAAGTLAKLLRTIGSDVRTARDGLDAVEVANDFRPEVMLLDIGLPRMDGYQVARRVRDQAWGQQMILIAVTGRGQEEDRCRAEEAGFDYHVTKPLNFAKLISLLEETMSCKNSAPGTKVGSVAPRTTLGG